MPADLKIAPEVFTQKLMGCIGINGKCGNGMNSYLDPTFEWREITSKSVQIYLHKVCVFTRDNWVNVKG